MPRGHSALADGWIHDFIAGEVVAFDVIQNPQAFELGSDSFDLLRVEGAAGGLGLPMFQEINEAVDAGEGGIVLIRIHRGGIYDIGLRIG